MDEMKTYTTSSNSLNYSAGSQSIGSATPKKSSEFDVEGARLENVLQVLSEKVSFLETRLTGVLRQVPVAEEGKDPSSTPSTGLGIFVRRQSEKVGAVSSRISDILDRLEI
jgi:hypothetical protein